MKKITLFTSAILIFTIAAIVPVYSQAFRKGSLILGLSEGSTQSAYSTGDDNNPTHPIHSTGPIHGVRDPISLEYGITNHWGIGFTSGTDIFTINPNSFYGTDALPSQVKANTSEFTLDASYHFFVTQKTDLSLTGSFGSAGVSISGDKAQYQYSAKGNMVRFGVHTHHYFYKRIGVLAMLTTYSSTCSTKNTADNSFGNNYSTHIKGVAFEAGLCFRLRH